ncbi:MAG: protein-L-isoaspartate O-methyltransferase family protein, partial [Steroidobacteraceae bacterium]
TGTERVLEIGSGSGFVTACLAALSASVLSLELFPELADLARTNLAAHRIGDAEIVTADAMQADFDARFDAIAVTASLPLYDERFQQRLDIGGRLFVVVGEPSVMEARLVRRSAEDGWSSESLFETVIDPLMNARRPAEFEF